MNDAFDAQAGDAPARSANWTGALIWSALGLVGWLVLELTAQPALGAAIVCSRFGWKDLRTALWLRRADPHRARRNACFWFCLSLGMQRILLAAFGLAMLIVAVQGVGPNPNAGDDLPAAFYGVGVLMLLGAPSLTVFALIGYVTARRGGILVWVDRSLAQAGRNHAWPPVYSSVPANPADNRVRLAWCSALITLALAGLVLPIIVLIFAGKAAGAIVLAAESPLIPLLSRRVIARHPAECWFTAVEEV